MNKFELQAFKKESEDFLKPFGYELHYYNGDNTKFSFSCSNKFYPAIDCFLDESGEKRMKLIDCFSYKLFLSLQSNNLSFKHPDLKQYLEVFEHYGNLASKYSPW